MVSNLVFLDIGANIGQSLEAAKLYQFGRIFCFEPVRSFYKQLLQVDKGTFQGHIICHNFGLYKENIRLPIYGPVDMAASLYIDHQDVKNETYEVCSFVRASEWMIANLSFGDAVVMKLNCEGAEIDILENLIETNILSLLGNVMVDFDAVKIPSKRAELRPLLQKLSKFNNIMLCDDVMHGPTHAARICNWLDKIGIPRI